MQGSLFIENDYLGFKIRKMGFFHSFSLKNKLQTIFARSCALVVHTRALEAHEEVTTLLHARVAHGNALMAHEASLCVRNLAFSSRFRSFFYLETPRNFKWIFFTFYCLQKPYKNPWTSIFMSLICRFTWFLATKHLKRLWSCKI